MDLKKRLTEKERRIRNNKVIDLRDNQNKTFEEIGLEFNLSARKARCVYIFAKRHGTYDTKPKNEKWISSLSNGLINALRNKFNVDSEEFTKEHVASLIKSGKYNFRNLPSLGNKRYDELCKCLGIKNKHNECSVC